jgi:hypothetical protein
LTQALTAGVLAVMQRAAREAILPRYQSLAAHEIDAKAADDVVTIADTEAELILPRVWPGCCPKLQSSARKPPTPIRPCSTGWAMRCAGLSIRSTGPTISRRASRRSGSWWR